MTKMRSGYAQRDFKDEGTGGRFKRGERIEVSEGSYINYEAAGLVDETKPKDEAPAAEQPADDATDESAQRWAGFDPGTAA